MIRSSPASETGKGVAFFFHPGKRERERELVRGSQGESERRDPRRKRRRQSSPGTHTHTVRQNCLNTLSSHPYQCNNLSTSLKPSPQHAAMKYKSLSSNPAVNAYTHAPYIFLTQESRFFRRNLAPRNMHITFSESRNFLAVRQTHMELSSGSPFLFFAPVTWNGRAEAEYAGNASAARHTSASGLMEDETS